jgi:hypothetical protein
VTDWEILYGDGNSVTQITNNNTDDAFASLYDGTVAWLGTDGQDHEIYYWDGKTTINVSDNDINDYHPSLYDGTIAWTGKPGAQWLLSEIYYWDGKTTTQLTEDNARDVSPSLYDGTIAWEKDWQISYWDSQESIDISTGISLNSSPSLYDGTIAWRGYDGNDWEIFYWDGTEVTQVTDDDVDAFTPALHNGTISWTANDGNDYEIYYAEVLPPPQSPPVAHAGSDQSVWVNDLVILDGSGSSDLDDDPLIHQWSFLFVPEGSNAALSNPTSVSPTFYVDLVGTYVVQLVVHDGTVQSEPSVVTITGENSPPEADAGENTYVFSEDQGDTVLHGTAVDADGDLLTCRWLEGDTELASWQYVEDEGQASLALQDVPLLSLGEHVLTLEVSDGQATSSDTMTLIVENSAPQAVASGSGVYQVGDPITVGGEVMDYDGDWLRYAWWVDGTIHAEGQVETVEEGEPVQLPEHDLWDLDVGFYTIIFQISDEHNDPVEAQIFVEVIDTEAPTLAPRADKNMLWPPNHKMMDLTIAASATDNSGGSVTLEAWVVSSEPENGQGDGHTAPDWTEPSIDQENGIITLGLRAERSGKGSERIYTVTIAASDEYGNYASVDVEILVPHDKGKGSR